MPWADATAHTIAETTNMSTATIRTNVRSAPTTARRSPMPPRPSKSGKTPIVVGGTGLYFMALTQGLAAIPAPGPEAKAEVAAVDEAALHDAFGRVHGANAYNLLLCEDPAMIAGCTPDLTADGAVDDADFVLFVAAYNELLCP